MRCCVWFLEDSLGPEDPALRGHPESPAVFVFDEDACRARPTSFKRLFFIYESLVETFAGREAPSEVRRGGVVREVFDFCRKHGAEEIHVTRAPWPEYRLYVEQLRANFVVVEHAPEEWVTWTGRAPRRFRDFWRAVAPQALPEDAPAPAGESEREGVAP